jgi:hypothetical protein
MKSLLMIDDYGLFNIEIRNEEGSELIYIQIDTVV